jgi:uncharacterized protein
MKTLSVKPDSTKSEESKQIVKAMYEAGVSGDQAVFFRVIHENAEVHEPTCLPYGGSYRGHSAIGSLAIQVGKFLDLSTLKIDYMLAEGDLVVTYVRVKTMSGNEVEMLEQSRVRDGKIVDLRIFYFDPTVLLKE